MPYTRSGGASSSDGDGVSLCRKRTRGESSGRCDDRSHAKLIANMKREILELNKALDEERQKRIEVLRDRRDSSSARREGGRPAAELDGEARRHALRELDLCKGELEDAREALRDACEEREALRVELSSDVRIRPDQPEDDPAERDAHPHLDWVGRQYLAVSLPEDRMFKPGEPVTPVGVLQKLFEMRVGNRTATGFSLMLENINIMLSHTRPEWYAQHFGFRRALVHGNKYRSADKVDTEDFAWLLFEYGAHAPLIEVLAGLLNVLNCTGKGGVTTAALCTSKSVYSSYVTLFWDTVSGAYPGFVRVRERALRTRKALGVVSVPLTWGLGDRCESRGCSHSVRKTVLRSVLEGIEAPPHVGAEADGVASGDRRRRDPLGLDESLCAFVKGRGLEGKAGKSSASNRDRLFPEPEDTRAGMSSGPLGKRVTFDSPWSK